MNQEKYSETESRELIQDLAEFLPPDEKESVTRAFGRLPEPTQKANDKIWLIVISAFASVFIGSFLVIAYDLFNGKEGIDDKLLTIFTTVSAFLAGLLAPSPVTKTT